MDEKGGVLGGKERGMVEVLKPANEAERAKWSRASRRNCKLKLLAEA